MAFIHTLSIRSVMALLAASALLPACSGSKSATENTSVDSPASLLPLVVKTDKATHRFDVEVASTPQAQEKGLMFRRELAHGHGMLFPMEPPRTASFWMKDTLIPLDMLFIRTDGSIAFIGADAQPYSRIPVSAGVPVAAVLEIPGGQAAALGIREGDRVNWGACAVPGIRLDKAWDRLNFCPATP